MWREIQLCSAGPPHDCEEFYNTATEEELDIIEKWSNLSTEQADGTRRRPDLKPFLSGQPGDKEGFYPPSFWCSALQKIRPDYSTPARLVRQDAFREENGTQSDGYSEPPHPEVIRAEDDISHPPSSSPPSLGEEPGRPGESDSCSDSSTESRSEDLEEDLPDGFDLPRFRAVQPCNDGPPHSCKEYCNTYTQEEIRQIVMWEEHCSGQLPAGEQSRPDIEDDKSGKVLPTSLACSLLREIRTYRM